jgi:hypothetical protein
MVGAMSDDTRSDQPRPAQSTDEARVMARRYFLRATLYAAPAIAGVVAVQHASAQTSYCAANCNSGLECTSDPNCGGCTACQ